MLKHLVLVMALVVPLVALSFPTTGGVGLLDSLGSLLFNRLTSQESTPKPNATAHQVLSSLAALAFTPGPVAASLRPKHHRLHHPKLLARRSAQQIDDGNDGDDADGQEDLRYGDLDENRIYPAVYPPPEDSDVYAPLVDDEQELLDRDSTLDRDGLVDDQQEEAYPRDFPPNSRPAYPDRSQQQVGYPGLQEPADLDGRSPIDLRAQQLDDDRQQDESPYDGSDPEAGEAPEDSDSNDQDAPNYNIDRDGDISDGDQEDGSQDANSQPGDVDYGYKKAVKRFKRAPNKGKLLKLKKALRKGRHAKKQRGNVNH